MRLTFALYFELSELLPVIPILRPAGFWDFAILK